MFLNIHGRHIEGRKNLSINRPIVNYLNPDFVYFPITLDNGNYSPLVNVGDSVLMGQPILMKEGRFSFPVFSSVSGKVTAIKKMWHSSGKMVEMLEIQNDYQESKFYKDEKYNCSDKNSFVSLVQNAGLVGLGGAGFPTYVKYQPDAPVDCVIVNAAECEPYITCDYMSMMEDPDKLLRGLSYVVQYCNAKRGVIAIKETKKPLIDLLKQHICSFNNIELFLLKDVYPAGWEKYIVEHVTKKSYKNLPREAGAIVDNTQTIMTVCDLVEHQKPLIERVVTITGEGIKNPGNYRVKIGSKVNALIESCGGYVDGLGDAYLICGGPMTGKPIVFDELVLTSTVGSVICKPKKQGKSSECIGCGKCSENCPAYLTPTFIKQAYEAKDTKLLSSLNATKCVQCGMCSYVCPSRIELTDYVGKAKMMLIKSMKK